LGISPIEYRPWEGERASTLQRFLVISKKVMMQKLKSKWVLALLIIGVILVHVFPIIFYTIVPHEELTPEIMVGEEIESYPYSRNVISTTGDVEIKGTAVANGTFNIDGILRIEGYFKLDGEIIGSGSVEREFTTLMYTNITENGSIQIIGSLTLNGKLEIDGNFKGEGTLSGNDLEISGSGNVTGAWVEEEDETINERIGGYLKSGLLVIFTILLASLVCADLIAEDLGDNSFILYFSRPIKSRDYLGGKMIGALWVLGMFCFIPPMIFCLAVMGTQSGEDYGTSLNVLGSTFIAGLLTAVIFVPYGILVSSLTKRKAYATIGIFMSFFVLTIIGNIFAGFDKNWVLIDPTRVLYYSYDILYGYSVPEGINASLLGVVLFVILVVPLIFVYLRVHLKAVGK
jgi:cytoskeletal protein CcmA (bactofilin family)